MSFHQTERQRIQEDEEDNQTLERILREFQESKKAEEQAKQEISNLRAEVDKLKGVVATYEEAKKKLEAQLKVRSHLYAKEQPLYFKDIPSPMSYSHTANSYFNVQQTKRKVINGFVAQLTHELENSEQLLLKQRKMHQEMRRNLQLCNEENQSLRVKNRALQNEMSTIMCQNRQLFSQLSEMQVKKQALDSQLQRILVQMNHCKASYLRRESEAQSQFMLMDQIYHQIQLQLQT